MKLHKNNLLLFIILLVIFFSITCYAKSYNIKFTWDRNTEEDLAGYKLYNYNIDGAYEDGNMILNIKDPNAYICELNNFEINDTTYFILTAYDILHNESGPSNQVLFIPDNISPNNPSGLKIKTISVIVDFE